MKNTSIRPIQGLALINGTQMITSMGAEAVERALAIAQQADIIAALTLEVLKGTTKAFDSGEQQQQQQQQQENHKTELYLPQTSGFCARFHFLVSSPADIHSLRPHPGQIEVAKRFRSLLDSDHHPSQIAGQRTDPDFLMVFVTYDSKHRAFELFDCWLCKIRKLKHSLLVLSKYAYLTISWHFKEQ